MKLTSGSTWEEMLPADYLVVTDVVLTQRELPFALMTIDVFSTALEKRIYRSEVELRSGTLQSIHDSFCEVLAEQDLRRDRRLRAAGDIGAPGPRRPMCIT